MRNFWVYHGGAWIKPSTVFAAAQDGTWRLIDTISIVSDGQYKTVLDQYVITINTAISLSRGGTEIVNPAYQIYQNYWQQMVSGRMLGDLNNDGNIDLFDILVFAGYTETDKSVLYANFPSEAAWIEQHMIPFMSDNPPPV